MADIKIIAFDLDGTLLNTQKELTPTTREALASAAAKGIEIVPATGRIWDVIPECVRNLDFIHYAVTLNGAKIFDVKSSKVIAKFEIPPERALKMARVFDDIDGAIYDVVLNDKGYIRRDFYEVVPDFMYDIWQTRIVLDHRKPVDNFYEIIENSGGVQKFQIYTLDKELRLNLLKALPIVFPKSEFASSLPNNVEINDKTSNKGNGLKALTDYLNLKLENILAFGDGSNDVSMIKAAGVGVAMKNSYPELLEVADFVTDDCDHDGVAKGIQKFCF